MGIFCQINLFKPPDGAYQPGQVVSGLIKYAIDEPMEIEKIITSLKGTGYVAITVKRGHKNRRITYSSSEVYVDVDNVVQDVKKKIEAGSYEIKFSFNLPRNLPSTLNIKQYHGRYSIRCKIDYYIRIKFQRPGIFAFNKHLRKQITVISGITPRLLREPVIYGETKKLMQLFSSDSNTVKIKATIFNSVISLCDKIELDYEVQNSSSVLVKSVEIKLVEIHNYKTTGHHEIETEYDVPDTDVKTKSIKCGDTQNMLIKINVPCHIHSLEHSKIVSRDYSVRITAQLPMPHRNAVLNIPVQIGRIDEPVGQIGFEGMVEEITYNEPPPPYWVAMSEIKKEDAEDDDK